MKILFTGDLFTGGQLVEENLYKDYLINIIPFNQADIRVCNLEQATSDSHFFEKKSTVFAPLNTLEFLLKNKIEVIALANNHIQDKGEGGLNDCLEELHRLNIKFTGAGRDLQQSSSPVYLANNLYLLSYCQYDSKYLRNLKIASKNNFGVHLLTFENIVKDLEMLPNNSKAILHFHWGKENVWFPPYKNIVLAKKILELDQVHSIVGMHAHRYQGCIKHNNKYAFFSLGNFLFPNFFIGPRTQMVYPIALAKYKITKEYHPVFSLTKKKWKYFNRVGMILTLNDEAYDIDFVKQQKDNPMVEIIDGFEKSFHVLWFVVMNRIYKYKSLYYLISFFSNSIDFTLKAFRILAFYLLKERKFFEIISLQKKKATTFGNC